MRYANPLLHTLRVNMLWQYGLAALGGAAGTVARLALSRGLHLPWGTLAANVAACLLLGILSVRLKALGPEAADTWRLLIGVGFCGGMSTFSTLALELVGYTQRGAVGEGMGYLALSLALGLGAVWAGMVLGR